MTGASDINGVRFMQIRTETPSLRGSQDRAVAEQVWRFKERRGARWFAREARHDADRGCEGVAVEQQAGRTGIEIGIRFDQCRRARRIADPGGAEAIEEPQGEEADVGAEIEDAHDPFVAARGERRINHLIVLAVDEHLVVDVEIPFVVVSDAQTDARGRWSRSAGATRTSCGARCRRTAAGSTRRNRPNTGAIDAVSFQSPVFQFMGLSVPLPATRPLNWQLATGN